MERLLIANRGEIARRIIRTCRHLGIQTVAVYSDVDRDALHVREADHAIAIGKADPADSYLNIPKLIDAAVSSGASAIHPGYGFLSENAALARACAEAGLIFIGPAAETIELMGDKLAAKARLRQHDIPVIDAHPEPLDSNTIEKIAKKMGYPVLLKAAAGGGGKGMRIVRQQEELTTSLQAAQREAQAAFGDGRVFMEKYIEQPRHIEVQILADVHQNIVHCFERDCSVQRRHQKIIEESPAINLSGKTRAAMFDTAVRTAQAVEYVNAGTLEFLVDPAEEFYFLEMNTRLQVEHPVTEWLTGLDLVRWQILIAQHQPLSYKQSDIVTRGHAIELRIYAEDPAQNFLPSAGRIEALNEPGGPGVRVDSALYPGWEVPVQYDPLLAKLSVWSENRPAAIKRALHALNEYRIDGIQTNIAFLKEVLSHPDFGHGSVDTSWVERELTGWSPSELEQRPEDPYTPWVPREASAASQRREAFKREHPVESQEDLSGPIQLKAPMPGKVILVEAEPGAKVEAGRPLIVIEAMKMEHSLSAPRDGTVTAVHKREGEQVGMREVLIEIA